MILRNSLTHANARCVGSSGALPVETPFNRLSTTRSQFTRMATALAVCVTGLLGVACGGAAMPTQQLTQAESSVKAAEVGGAEKLPKGELHLKYARDAVAEARRLIEEGENEAARLALERAKADADKALALADEQKARDEAEAELKRIEEMMKK